ncbi:MAG: hypothetical protein DSZ02_08195 [Gammaproteobacteria bacterium]|nr:MAG: hypothetical protein DSZ02_08195 [Gammaproteobacteria bacterium]
MRAGYARMRHTPDRKKVLRLLRYQVFMLLPVSLGALVFGELAAWSALIGGMVALAANVLFAVVVFGNYQAAQAGSLVVRFYAAEVLKLVVVGLAFAALFIWMKQLNVAALFVAFFVVQVVSPLLAHLSAGDT